MVAMLPTLVAMVMIALVAAERGEGRCAVDEGSVYVVAGALRIRSTAAARSSTTGMP